MKVNKIETHMSMKGNLYLLHNSISSYLLFPEVLIKNKQTKKSLESLETWLNE